MISCWKWVAVGSLVILLAGMTAVLGPDYAPAQEDAITVYHDGKPVNYFEVIRLFRSTFLADSAAERAAIRREVASYLARYREGEDFAALAAQYSERPEEEEERGEIERPRPHQLNEEQLRVLSETAIGETTVIMENPFGYEVFLLTGINYVAVPTPTPTPAFEKRMAASSIPAHAFRPENSEVPWFIEDGFIWTTEKNAVFYAPIQFPDAVEISGFCVWLRDCGGQERPVSELRFYNFFNMSGSYDLIARRVSDGPWPPDQYSMGHYPGAEFTVNNSFGGFVVRVTLNSGDRRQAIRGAMAIYTFNQHPGRKMGEDAIEYIASVQSHPGVCPVCVMRQREQVLTSLREREMRAAGDSEIPSATDIEESRVFLEWDYEPVPWTPPVDKAVSLETYKNEIMKATESSAVPYMNFGD